MMPNNAKLSVGKVGLVALSSLLLCLVFSGFVPVPAQEKLDEKEVDKLAKQLLKWHKVSKKTDRRGRRITPNPTKVEREKQKFLKEFEKIQKAHQKVDILSLTESWGEVFTIVADDDKKRSASGAGRVKTDKTKLQNFKGNAIGYEYAIRIPKGYTNKQSWPLIIALHDKGSTGDKYLKEVWDKNVPAEVLDQFVIIAPTLGSKTLGKARDQQRLEWFNIYHVLGVFWPLTDVLENLTIDTDRVYLDGCGTGGQMAVHLGALRSKQFAAISARTTTPKTAAFVRNLSSTPIRFASRKGFWDSGDPQAAMKELAAIKGEGKVDIEFLTKDGGDPKRREPGVDPVAEASKEIGEFFLKNKRQSYPSEISFVTDEYNFRASEWIWMRACDLEKDLKLYPSVHAKADRATNTITIQAENCEKLQIFVNDQLLDLDKPIKVLINGETVTEQKIERSLDYILDFHRNNPLDPKVLFAGALNVQVPIKAAEEKKDEEKKTGEAPK